MAQEFFQAKAFIATIEPYVAGKPVEETAREYGLNPENIVKLASNENPVGMSPTAEAAMAKVAKHLSRYPDGNARDFRAAVARHHGLEAEWVLAGNGSDETLGLIARLVLEPETHCIYSQYSFSVYELCARENGARCVMVPTRDFAVDLEAMAAAVTDQTRLIFVTNPNNPTGLPLREEAIVHFIENVRARNAKTLIVLDEAYIDFMEKSGQGDSIALVKRYSSLVVTRTFSKAYGLAGLRAGYAIAHPELIEMLNRIRPPFNMNVLAQAAAAAAIDDSAFVERVVQANRAVRATMMHFFAGRGLRYLESSANFVMVELGSKAARIHEELLKRGVIVRPLTSYGLPSWLRVSVGSAEQNERFMHAFDAASAAASEPRV